MSPLGLQRNSLRMCFWSQDLYTTAFGDIQNDDIVCNLFGEIDDDGAHAVRVVLSGDVDQFHKYFIDSTSPSMRRSIAAIVAGVDPGQATPTRPARADAGGSLPARMHVTVLDIVSTESSDVNFIFTEYPVTVYHRNCAPDTPLRGYPNIPLKGSQTLFPRGLHHCLIPINLVL